MNFQIGDRVRIKSRANIDRYGRANIRHGWNDDMYKLCGRFATIVNITGKDILLDNWSNNEGTSGWQYSTDMIEKVESDNMENNMIKCEDCGRELNESEVSYVENVGYVCEDCLDNYYQCDCCGRYFREEDVYTHDDQVICQECYEQYDYSECHECGYMSRYLNWDEYSEEYYCDSCWEECCGTDDRIAGWHDHHGEGTYDIHYLASGEIETKDTILYGREIEIEPVGVCGSMRNAQGEIIDTLVNTIPCVQESDGSLPRGGFENITFPLSKPYIYQIEDKIKLALDTMINVGFGAEEHCGSHIHATRPNENVINRIELIMETYKDQIIKLSRRHSSRWAAFLSDSDTSGDEKKNKALYYIDKKKKTSNRYMALNLTNEATIEFRIFKGTLDFETFMSDYEFVFNIMELCSNEELPISEITWDKLTSGKYISAYCEEHDIHSDIIPVDYSEEILSEQERKYKQYRQVINGIYKIANQIPKVVESRVNATKKAKDRDTLQKLRQCYASVYSTLDRIDCDIASLEYYLDGENTEDFRYSANNLLCIIRDRFSTDSEIMELVGKLQNKVNKLN